MKDKYVFYDVDGERFSVRESEMSEFEKDFPNAIINMSVDGENFPVKLSEREDFLRDFGDGASYTNFDEKEEPEPRTKITEANQKPKKDSLNNILTSVNDSLMRARLGANKTFADQQMEKVTAPAPEIDRDMADLVIESHRGNKTRVDEYLAEQDKTGYNYDPTKMVGSIPMPAIGLANNMYLQSKKAQKTKGQDYTDALVAQRLQGKVEDKVEQYLDPSKTFLGGAKEGFKDTAFDLDTWDSGMAAEDAARVYAISKKLDKGGELTEGEDMIIEALVDDLASDIYLAAGFGRGYKAGQVTGESLPFMVETMLNPASKFGESITKKFGKEIFKRVGKRLGAKAARAAVHGTRVLSDMAGAAMMSATTSQARVAEDALNRLSGQVDFEINEDGTLGFKGFVGGEDSAFKAYAKAYGANTIEHFSEMVGNYFAPMGQMAKEGTAALANKVGLKKVGELLAEMTPNGFGSLVNDFAEQTQWHGMIGEFAEEMVSGAMNALVVGDQALKKYDENGNLNENYLFEKDNMIDTFLGVAILGGVMSTAKTLGYTTPETRYNREISKARKNLEGKLSNVEMAQLEAFASNPMGMDYANLRPFFEEGRSKESRDAVARYLKAVMEKQGYNISREADLSGTQQGMNEMRTAWTLGQNMTEADLYDVDEALNQAVAEANNAGLIFTLEDVSQRSSYDLFNLSQHSDYTPEERAAVRNLAIIKNAQEGLNNKLDAAAQSAVAVNNKIANNAAKDGVLTIGVLSDGRRVFVKGDVKTDHGKITTPDFVSSYPVEIVDAMTGETMTVESDSVHSVLQQDVASFNNFMANVITTSFEQRKEQWRNTKSAKSKLAEIQNYVGEKVYIKTANNDMAEVEVQQILPNGEVLIKGKKGDLGGQSTIRVDVDSFYDSISRDANGNPIFNQSEFRSQTQGIADAQNRMYVQGEKARDARKPIQQAQVPVEEQPTEQEAPQAETPQEQTPETEVPQTPVEPTGEADFRDFADTIILNGRPIKVDEVTAQDDVSDSITYRYTDENGVQRTGNMTIGAFAEAVNLGRQQTETPAPEPTIETPEPMPAEPVAPVEPSPMPEPQPAPAENIELEPESINWDALFEQDKEAYFAELQKQYGEETLDILNEEIQAAQEELDELGKKRGKDQNERLENRKKKAALQNRIDVLKGMVARLTAAPEVPAEAAPVSETPQAPVAPAEQAPVAEATEVTQEPVSDEPIGETPQTPTEPSPIPAEPESAPEATAIETPIQTEPEPIVEPIPSPEPTAKPKGGAIARMISSAKGQIAKLASKANIKDFTVDDNVHPVFGGVLRKGGYEYASDSQVLAKIKTSYPVEQEEKIYSVKTGQEISGRFPNADLVISSAENVNTEIDADIDDILATAQAAEELKKGLDKSKKIYVRVGRSIFNSSYLLKAARMAKHQGLTTISQHPTEDRAMLFAGNNGVVLIMPVMSGKPGKPGKADVIDSANGEATFDDYSLLSIKTPSSLKGIETARGTIEAILPNLSEASIDNLKNSDSIKLVDGKVYYNFLLSDIVNAKNKAKDPNTYAALEDIEKNGLEIPLSASEIAKVFPETAIPSAPTTPVTSVANPIDEARKKERQLALNLKKVGLSPEAKQDLAFNAGKAIANMFSTREEYDAYAETATDFGAYNADFERGVDESFANRSKIESGSPVNSVPLESEPNGEDNGTDAETPQEEVREGQSSTAGSEPNNDEKAEGPFEESGEGSKAVGRSGNNQVGLGVNKYPTRNGDIKRSDLADVFGLTSVSPALNQSVLNSIYDFMMEMSKMLGISPKSIGHGATLGVKTLNNNSRSRAQYSFKYRLDGTVVEPYLNFKNAKLQSIAHEWFHSLDQALSYYETGKGKRSATNAVTGEFSGRQETLDAIKGVIKAINKSGHKERLNKELSYDKAFLKYSLRKDEMAARAFEEYIRMKFAEAGIEIEGLSENATNHPTPEEMAIIAPAIDNLFKVLQEKEGKKPGTSILYHIGEMMEPGSEAWHLATDAVLTALDDSGVDVVRATDEQAQQMMDVMEEVSELQKGKAPETVSVQDEHHQTVVSSADGAKVLKDLDSAIDEYESDTVTKEKTFLGNVAKVLGAKKHGSNSQYATFEAKNGKVFTIRLANHNAKVSNFDNHNEDDGISIVIASAPNSGVDNDGKAHIVEFYYDSIKLRKAEGKPLVEILKSIKQSLYSGEYKDNTGLAQVQEVNAPELMTVYHGSPSLFDEFDHSHMGEGEGAQAHGYGTYVAKSADTAKAYARMGRVSYTGPRQSYGSYEYEVVEDIVSIMNHGNSFDEAIQIGRRYWSNLKWEPSHRAKRAFLETLTPEDFKLRNLYDVEIPEDNGENYFYESNPTKKQVEKLYDACQREGLEYAEVIAGETLLDNRPAGKKITSNLAKMLGSPQAASDFLSRAGFVGIKYDGRRDGECFVIFNESDAKITGRTEFYQTPNGTVYGWTDGKKIYLTQAGLNPNTPIHEYTHLWAKAMMQKNPKGWESIKKLLKGTPVWNVVMNDANYSNIHSNEDLVASEALSRISGSENAAKMEKMAQQMIDEAKGTGRKLEARGLIQNMKDALNKFWEFVWKDLFKMTYFRNVEHVTDRVLFDLLNNTDLGELSEGQVETQIVTDPKIIAELEASPKRTGYRNVVQNEDGTFSSPMAYWLQGKKGGAKTRVETAKFELGKWEEAEEHPELVDEKGHVVLVKPNKNTVEVAYDPYIHNRLDPVNLQFKDAWKRDELVYVETEVPETDLESGYHADEALLSVGVHSWSNGALMLSKYDKPVRIMPWEDVADAWVARLNGEGVEFDVVPPALRSLLVERGVEILPPHKGMGKDCNDAYKEWKNSEFKNNSLTSQSYENTEDAYATNDGRGTQPETEGVQGEVSMSGPLGEERRLYNPEGREVSQSDFSRFNPIHEREGESDNRRNLRETRFFETFEKLTIDEKLMLYNFLRESFHKSSGILRSMTRNFINTVRQNGNNSFADFVENFINDELKYREGISAKIAARHGVLIGVSYDASRLEQIFDAYNEDKYNETLFDRAIRLAKRFGVSVEFVTRDDDGSFFSAFGNYNPSKNKITLDANLLVDGNTADLCQTIVHELIHSVVARAASIMSGRAVDNNKQFIDPQSLPNDVIEGINMLKEVYEAIKDDGTFQDTYGKKDFEEMLSEISDPKFRGLLKAKKLWKKFLNGICRILGIADESSSESDALTEIESALDKILSSAERGELDSAYASYLGQLAEGYTLDDLQRLESGPVKTMLTQNKLFRTGIDPTQVATQTASLVYDQVVSDTFQEFQRQFQDAMQPVRIAIDAIQQETGNIPIEDYENYLLIQNQSSSRSRVEIDDFARRYYSPIIEQVNKIIDTILESRGYDKNDRVKRSEVYKEVKTYLIAKHGLERNKYYQSTKTRRMKSGEMKPELDQAKLDYDDKVNQINADTTLTDAERQLQLRDALDEYNATVQEIQTREVPDIRDYSGLTTLFATENLDEAERRAQEAVDNFENTVATDELWAKINAATDKTLRHSYESGLLSRQQYNDIKDMFKFYIPLRGFDESTAEDVYAYARFEGNRFNPAVHKAKGRTSLANDPIAIIMNMAESEIAQGNKNRAKQALYNFLLNRPVMRTDGNQHQNSLMQIEDVWYIESVDANGKKTYQIAAPDHAAGESWEDFENRMMADPNAIKSKKGQVDIGMRFQKQSHKDAHYVYLKVNGVEKAIYINGNPKAADAINGTYAPLPGEAMQKVKDVQRLVSSTFTNYSLEFTARNYFRDMVYSHINIGVREPDPAYRKKFRQNWRHNNMGTMLKMLQAYRAGEYDGRPLNEDEAAFVEFMNNGGQTGYTLINSVEAHKKELERAIKRMQNGIVKGGVKDSTIFKYTLGGVELLNEASELVTRFAAFKTSRDMGRGIVRSINDAKEVTVNFNTKGAQDGKGWMGIVARYLGAVKYFFNASVQGVQNLGAAFQKNKLKFGFVVGGTIGLGIMMPILQGALSELMGGDEDEYWNIPEYDRQNNLCFVIGKGKYVKLPLPIGFREMYGLGDLIIAGFANKKFVRNPLSVGMDVANKIATVVLPINPIEGAANGLSLVESGQNMLLPDFLQGMVQNRTNTDFKGVPIQKEYTYNENDPQWTKAFANNPSWLKGLSKWCYENIEIDGEGWDWSPEKLDNTFSNAFGGIYSLLKKTGKTVSAIWNEDNRTLSNVPLVGVIVGSNIDDDQRFVNSTYWEMDEYYNKRLYKIKSTAANFGLTLDDVFARNPEGERAGEHHPAMNKIYNKHNFDFMQEWYLGHKGEGETDENEEKILGLSQIKNKIKNLENKIKKNEDGVATPEQDEELVELNNEYEATRRDLVNDLLELD